MKSTATTKPTARILVYAIGKQSYNARFFDHGTWIKVQIVRVGRHEWEWQDGGRAFHNRNEARDYWRELVSKYGAFRAPAEVEAFFNN